MRKESRKREKKESRKPGGHRRSTCCAITDPVTSRGPWAALPAELSRKVFQLNARMERVQVQVVKSQHGKELMVVDGYLFNLNSVKSGRYYWQCQQRYTRRIDPVTKKEQKVKMCSARVIATRDNQSYKLETEMPDHDCDPSAAAVHVAKFRTQLKGKSVIAQW